MTGLTCVVNIQRVGELRGRDATTEDIDLRAHRHCCVARESDGHVQARTPRGGGQVKDAHLTEHIARTVLTAHHVHLVVDDHCGVVIACRGLTGLRYGTCNECTCRATRVSRVHGVM